MVIHFYPLLKVMGEGIPSYTTPVNKLLNHWFPISGTYSNVRYHIRFDQFDHEEFKNLSPNILGRTHKAT